MYRFTAYAALTIETPEAVTMFRSSGRYTYYASLDGLTLYNASLTGALVNDSKQTIF